MVPGLAGETSNYAAWYSYSVEVGSPRDDSVTQQAQEADEQKALFVFAFTQDRSPQYLGLKQAHNYDTKSSN